MRNYLNALQPQSHVDNAPSISAQNLKLSPRLGSITVSPEKVALKSEIILWKVILEHNFKYHKSCQTTWSVSTDLNTRVNALRDWLVA